MKKPPVCIQCKYVFKNQNKYECLCPKVPYKFDIVTGEYFNRNINCYECREDEEFCGYEAGWFRRKNELERL